MSKTTTPTEEPDEVEYVFYVGDPIGQVSLWERRGDEFERPIYANTRGQKIWFSSSPSEYNFSGVERPTEAFWQALYGIRTGQERVDLEHCEWWEREAIHSLGNMLPDDLTRDAKMLFEHAMERSSK